MDIYREHHRRSVTGPRDFDSRVTGAALAHAGQGGSAREAAAAPRPAPREQAPC